MHTYDREQSRLPVAVGDRHGRININFEGLTILNGWALFFVGARINIDPAEPQNSVFAPPLDWLSFV